MLSQKLKKKERDKEEGWEGSMEERNIIMLLEFHLQSTLNLLKI